MLSDTSMRAIKLRLRIANYNKSAALYWDIKSDKCVLSHSYIIFNWANCYYFGFLVIAVSTLFLYLQVFMDDIQDDEINAMSSSAGFEIRAVFSIVAKVAIIMIVVLACFCEGLCSVFLQTRGNMCALFNGTFELDKNLKDKFNHADGPQLIKDIIESNKILDVLTVLSCIITALFPMLFVVSFFSPADPLHLILEEMFELKVELSIPMILIDILYGYCAFCMGNTFFVFVLTTLCMITSSVTWLKALMPEDFIGENGHYCQTRNLRVVDSETIILIYRYLQILACYCNEIMAKDCRFV
ncbi:unnamed protein product [Orchesella dallaii]|uniref:Uncharacterized protein n=1 Tax=Orchesella dallaii TaxID=48710 RepID=A0ABP1RPD4_9HEXA